MFLIQSKGNYIYYLNMSMFYIELVCFPRKCTKSLVGWL